MIKALRILAVLLALLVAFVWFSTPREDPGCCSGLARDRAGR